MVAPANMQLVGFYFVFFFFAISHAGLRDLSSLTRDCSQELPGQIHVYVLILMAEGVVTLWIFYFWLCWSFSLHVGFL